MIGPRPGARNTPARLPLDSRPPPGVSLGAMSDENDIPLEGPGDQPAAGDGGDDGLHTERVPHAPISARVPDHVAAGIFCTGVMALEGQDEFVLDFVQGMGRPPRVGARIVLSPRVMGLLVDALRQNVSKYEKAFGPAKPIPKPKNEPPRRSIPEIYEDLKLPDEMFSGTYATTVMISHTPAEFLFDFITRFFPTAAVSARVFMAASQVPRVLETLSRSLDNHRRRRRGEQPPAGEDPGPMLGP
ncbi:MAG TPA: DUF3467 domain-containing protein [Phycisphaerae bacterium]|nr:DUF3467 domain-containing protein [Phycisphaerae bacterium]